MNSLLVIFSTLLCAFCSIIECKVLIISHHYNRPDFIERQYEGLKRYLSDEYEFVVFNDAVNPAIKEQIAATCLALGLRCIDIPQEIHDKPYLFRFPVEHYHHPAVRNSNVVQWSLDQIGFDHNGIVVTLDSDIFLIKPFSVEEFMQGYALAGISQYRGTGENLVHYLWIGLVFMDMNQLPDKRSLNFNCGRVNDVSVDAGGHTAEYLRAHPEVPVRYDFQSNDIDCDKRSAVLKSMRDRHDLVNIELFYDTTFFHYRGGTNWDNQSVSFHEKKTRELNSLLEDLWEASCTKN